jgi:hypothetical protein
MAKTLEETSNVLFLIGMSLEYKGSKRFLIQHSSSDFFVFSLSDHASGPLFKYVSVPECPSLLTCISDVNSEQSRSYDSSLHGRWVL